MKKKLLTILFPVMLTLALALAGWATEQGAPQPACERCAKAVETQSAGCGNCAKAGKAEKRCGGGASKQAAAEASPTSGAGCDKCAKAQQAELKPCCNKGKLQEL